MSGTICVRNEWDPLKAVIVGIADSAVCPDLDWVCENYAGITEGKKEMLKQDAGKKMADLDSAKWVETEKEANALAALLVKEGIEVIRPRPGTQEEMDAAPTGYMTFFERDPILAVGNEIIHIFCRCAFRRKSHATLFKQLSEYTKKSGQIYISQPMPSPGMPLQIEEEPYLEGGDIFVLGKDILVGHSGIASSTGGIQWLQQHLAPKGYTVHTVELTKDWLHLDCVFMTPREGLAVCYLGAVKEGKKGFPAFMQSWTWIEAQKAEA
eukprot:Filipodium_phascolosomae@DN2711_c1_g1_i18.p1